MCSRNSFNENIIYETNRWQRNTKLPACYVNDLQLLWQYERSPRATIRALATETICQLHVIQPFLRFVLLGPVITGVQLKRFSYKTEMTHKVFHFLETSFLNTVWFFPVRKWHERSSTLIKEYRSRRTDSRAVFPPMRANWLTCKLRTELHVIDFSESNKWFQNRLTIFSLSMGSLIETKKVS